MIIIIESVNYLTSKLKNDIISVYLLKKARGRDLVILCTFKVKRDEETVTPSELKWLYQGTEMCLFCVKKR